MEQDRASLRAGTHIFTWGRGDLGQLGTERDTNETQPVLVTAVESKDVAHVAASVFNSAYITGLSNATYDFPHALQTAQPVRQSLTILRAHRSVVYACSTSRQNKLHDQQLDKGTP